MVLESNEKKIEWEMSHYLLAETEVSVLLYWEMSILSKSMYMNDRIWVPKSVFSSTGTEEEKEEINRKVFHQYLLNFWTALSVFKLCESESASQLEIYMHMLLYSDIKNRLII